MVVGLELLVSVHLSVDSRRLDLLGVDRIYGAKVITKTEVMLLKEEMPGGEFVVGNFAPLNSLGQEILGRSFLLWFNVFPSFLHQLEFMGGRGGVGCACVVANWSQRPSC